jgi:RsiW-degrading membrane proteinase PrsW (M82 family)
VNALLCGGAFLLLHILSTMIPQVYILAAVYTAISLYMLPAGLEEASKHIATVDSVDISIYRLPQVLLVAIYTALGFVYIENILYIYQIYMTGSLLDVLSGISLRSLFSLCAHVFATCIGAYFWYIASRQSIYSFRYIYTFLAGICTAILAHIVFNALLETQSMTLLLVYSAIAYTVVVRWLWME